MRPKFRSEKKGKDVGICQQSGYHQNFSRFCCKEIWKIMRNVWIYILFFSYGMLGISKQVWRSGWKWWANLLFEGRIQLPDENVLCKCQRIRSQYARCGSSDTFTNLEFRIYEFFLAKIYYDFFFNWQTEKQPPVLNQ